MTKAYCGAHTIISPLGFNSGANYACVESYATNFSRYAGQTTVGLIDRTQLNLNGLSDYTFAEQLSIRALSELIARSGVALDDVKNLLILSTTKGNIDRLNSDFDRCFLWAMADRIAGYFSCHNKPLVVSNACISGVASIIMASRFIERGEYDNVIILGVDVVSEFVVSGFNSFKSISSSVCKPFDASRDGLTLGEACGVLLLTNNPDLSDSKIFVSGGGISNDANHISGPSRSGDGLFYAIDEAMKQAGVPANEIGFINAHGTGTLFNDEMESKAFEMASLAAVPCNSLKPYFGHTLGASGVVETILCVAQMVGSKVFGVNGYEGNGVPFELNVSAKHRDLALHHCLKTASGFGGTNAALVLSKEPFPKGKQINPNQDNIVEVAHVVVEPQAGVKFAEYIRDRYKSLGESNLKFFKMDNLSKLGYVASCLLMKDVCLSFPSNRIGIVLASRSGSLDTDMNHQKIVDQHLPEGASPAVFVYTLANVVAAEMAIKHKFQGELTVFIREAKDLDFLCDYSQKLIASDLCDAVLYGWCDLLNEEYNAELKLIKRE
ncbi:MAG: beta-ketoacyl-[acyl-carrier-protein] synthase family protein [Breznakibacter sp.]